MEGEFGGGQRSVVIGEESDGGKSCDVVGRGVYWWGKSVAMVRVVIRLEEEFGDWRRVWR